MISSNQPFSLANCKKLVLHYVYITHRVIHAHFNCDADLATMLLIFGNTANQFKGISSLLGSTHDNIEAVLFLSHIPAYEQGGLPTSALYLKLASGFATEKNTTVSNDHTRVSRTLTDITDTYM